ncbi:MAG: nucleotidyl transferase AbiEii/AbiGii toxin family protein [Anaerolineales bacterium]|nr:nucleotidyl transferase AbiEii/AbiGii toxin family protein [Anaerolineales bacterium]
MKAYIEQLLKDVANPIAARNLLREYLQARILQSLQRAGAMIPFAFHGGTALRFLYAIPRFSEDLDFTLERSYSNYDMRAYLRAIQSDLEKEGYHISIKLNETKTVNSAFVKFHNLLYEFGLSVQREEILSVKIEVDTQPPAGAALATTLIRRHVPLHLQHHDRATLLAGKIHAFLQRRYVKGRDLYDLLWYLSDPQWPSPNFVFLQNALQQTGWSGLIPGERNWRVLLYQKLQALDWKRAVSDVKPFLERPDDVLLLSRENFEKLLGCSP